MSYFSDMLDNYIYESGISLNELASLSGINRTYISKIRNGTRIIRDEGKMIKLVHSLRCSPEQEERLLREYRIEAFGREKYHTIQAVKELIQSMALETGRTFVKTEIELPEIKNAIYGKNEVNYILNAILFREANKKEGHIRILAQQDLTVLSGILPGICCKEDSLTVEHITCLRSSNVYGASLYNLNCLKTFMPALMSGCDYSMHYYYGENSHINSMNVLPYVVVTSEFAMSISYGGDMAILHPDTGIVEAYARMLDELKANCRQLVDTFSFGNRFEQFEDGIVRSNSKDTVLALCNTPALTPFVTEDILERRLRYTGEEKAAVFAGVMNMNSAVNDELCVKFFSFDGLKSFMHTGRISGIPHEMYDPLDESERLGVLKRWFELCSAGKGYSCIAVQPSMLTIPDNLVIEASDVDNILLSYTHPMNSDAFFTVMENSISTNIFDFLKYLQKGNMVYDEEYTLDMANKLIKQFEADIS